jgi:hypothetical protein
MICSKAHQGGANKMPKWVITRMLVAIGSIADTQAKATQATLEAIIYSHTTV